MSFTSRILKRAAVYVAIGVVSGGVCLIALLLWLNVEYGDAIDERFITILFGAAYALFGPPVALAPLTALKWQWWRGRAPSFVACALLCAVLGIVPVIAIGAFWGDDFWSDEGPILCIPFAAAGGLFGVGYAWAQRRFSKVEPRGFAPIMFDDDKAGGGDVRPQ